MKALRSVALAFTMFSRLPMPKVAWREDNMAYALGALPLVGLLIGLLLPLWQYLCALLACGPLLRAVGLTLLPLLISGGLHLDGLADTADALASHALPERKREILKDPHCGAFAVIAIVAYLLLFLALAAELPARPLWLLLPLPVLSRALTAIATLTFPSCGQQGLADAFRAAASKGALIAALLWAAAAAAALIWLEPLRGAAICGAAVLSFVYVRRLALRQFGGISGDVAGFLLQLSELLMLAALALIK